MANRHSTQARVAIIGSGPSGMYAADHLLKCDAASIAVDVYERLPTPWGLVRAGVAPDHPKIKSVTRVYEAIANHPRLTLYGNVAFGEHVTREELMARYNAVIYAVGTPADRLLEIPGEELPGSHAATDFVGWYNGHPDHRDRQYDLSCRRAVVIGNGNVALDLARILTLDADSLRATDIADHALTALSGSAITEVVVVGRRGPAQAAFTSSELRELGELKETAVSVDAADLEHGATSEDPAVQRKLEILSAYSRSTEARRRRISLRFLLSPTRIIGSDRAAGVELVHNVLEHDHSGVLRARSTGRIETVPAGLVLRAVGYRGRALPNVPFDEDRGTIPNSDGRVAVGEYVVGWAKRGPSGVIGTNKKDALETVSALTEDLRAGRLTEPGHPPEAIESFLLSRQPQLLSLSDWRRMDLAEQAAGHRCGRPRVKLTTVASMVEAATTELSLAHA